MIDDIEDPAWTASFIDKIYLYDDSETDKKVNEYILKETKLGEGSYGYVKQCERVDPSSGNRRR